MIAMGSLRDHLKPTDDEIEALALRETDPAQAARFGPITRGPLFAMLAMAAVVLAAIPACVVRIVRGLLGSRPGAR